MQLNLAIIECDQIGQIIAYVVCEYLPLLQRLLASS